jgi:hypothetical protein
MACSEGPDPPTLTPWDHALAQFWPWETVLALASAFPALNIPLVILEDDVVDGEERHIEVVGVDFDFIIHANLNLVKKVVNGVLKRLGLRRTKSVLHYLGTNSWETVLEILTLKREAWNAQHPKMPMTATNTALDHIRPVREFQKEGKGAQTLLCNHYTNLQPLLLEDNNWEGGTVR